MVNKNTVDNQQTQIKNHLSRVLRKTVFGVSDQVRAVKSLKLARGLKFWIKKVEELYYPCSENKGANQLHCDLCLCFHIITQKAGFLMMGSLETAFVSTIGYNMQSGIMFINIF